MGVEKSNSLIYLAFKDSLIYYLVKSWIEVSLNSGISKLTFQFWMNFPPPPQSTTVGVFFLFFASLFYVRYNRMHI